MQSSRPHRRCAAPVQLDDPSDLRGSSRLSTDFEISVVAHRFNPASALPGEELTADLSELATVYAAFVEGHLRQRRSWIFQALVGALLDSGS